MKPTTRHRIELRLAAALTSVVMCDERRDYDERAIEIYRAMQLALQLDYRAGIEWDGDSTDPDVLAGRRAVAVIELPRLGQVRWHMREYGMPYDGSTTQEKNKRIEVWIKGLGS